MLNKQFSVFRVHRDTAMKKRMFVIGGRLSNTGVVEEKQEKEISTVPRPRSGCLRKIFVFLPSLPAGCLRKDMLLWALIQLSHS